MAINGGATARVWALAAGVGLGALGMFLLDPVAGRRRRAIGTDKITSWGRMLGAAGDALLRDLRHRTVGAVAEVKKWSEPEAPVDPQTLIARVRSAIGRATRHASAVRVTTVDENHIVLAGDALESEAPAIVAAAEAVAGVAGVEDCLRRHPFAGSVPSLQDS